MNVPFVDLRRLHAGSRAELLAAFARVIDSAGYVQGREVESFEHEFSEAYGVNHAVAVSNGTAALHLALIAAGVGPGDEVITVANTFIATAEAVSMVGAVPVFADVQPGSYLMDPADVERKVTARTRALIVVHLYGEMAEMAPFQEIATRHNLRLIEDACQAHGATADGRRAGTVSDLGCLSFYPTKNLGTVGEGGMVLTADKSLASRVRSLRDHGQTSRHRHAEPGYNYRMPELQAAALRVFLPQLERWNARRVAAARRYRAGLADSPVCVPAETATGQHVYHLFVVRSPQRDALQQFLSMRGIGTAIHYPTPIHLQPAYAREGSGIGSLPQTERAVSEILSLPMHPAISSAEVDAVCDAVRAFGRSGAERTNREGVTT